MDDISIQLELARVKNSLSDQFANALENLAQHNGLQGVQEVKNRLEKTPSSLYKALLDDVQNIWDLYLHPFDSRANFYSMVYLHLSQVHKTKMAMEDAKKREQYYRSTRPPNVIQIDADNSLPGGAAFLGPQPPIEPPNFQTSLDPPQIDLQKWVISEGKIVRGISPVTKMPLERPLEFEGPISLKDDFEDCMIRLPFVKTLNLHVSLKNILIKCQKYGYTKEMCKKLFNQIVYEYYPGQSFVIENCKTPNQSFNVILNLVTPQDYLQDIGKALENLQRDPGMSLRSMVDQYQTLIALKFQYTMPFLSHYQILQKSQNMTRHTLRHFVSEKCQKALDTFMSIRRQQGEEPDISAQIGYLAEIESRDPSYCITTPLSVPSHLQPSINLFKTFYGRSYQPRS